MRQFAITIFALIFAALAAKADVAGKVYNEQREPVMGASVALLELPDSTFVNGSTTAADGSFSITGEKPAAPYLLKVQAYGYEAAELEIGASTPRPLDITLKLASTELGEVVVRGKAPVTTREGGKYIFIPNDLVNDVSNARFLMDYVPLVSWSDRQVSILGKGTSKIYLNGKDPHWSTIEVSSMLRTLDPRFIKRVEIITDPGATQEASYTGGIVNIIYDDPSQGLRGVAIATTSLENDNPSVWPNLWLNYQKNKFKASLNLEYYYKHNYNRTTNSYDYWSIGRTVVNEGKSTSFGNTLVGRLNLSYDLTKRSVLGVNVSLGASRDHRKSVVNTVTRTDDGQEETSTMRQTQDARPDKPDIFAMAYYTLNLDNKGSMIDVLAAYGGMASHTDVKNVFSGVSAPQLFEGDTYTFSGKAEFTKVFNPTTRFLAGVSFVDSHLKNNQTFDNVFDRFKYYDRQLHAYVQFNKRWNNYLSTDIGLRLENTHTQGRQLQDEQANTQDYTDLFPSFTVSWNIPQGNQGLSLTYRRSINRPGTQMLNPYRIWSSDNTYSQGNPDLKPEYADFVSFSYSFLNKFIFHAIYNYSSQLTTLYTTNTPEGMTISSYTNSGRQHYVSLSGSYNMTAWNFWRIGADVNAFYMNIKTRAGIQSIHTSGWSFALSQSNTFMLSRKHFLKAILSQDLISPTNKGTYKEDWRYVVHVGLQKSFNFGLDVSLTGSIPITGYKTFRTLTLPDYSYTMHTHNHRYILNLTLSYTFGKKQVQGARDRSKEIKGGL